MPALQHFSIACDRHKHEGLHCAASLDMRALWCWTVKSILLAEATHQWQPDSTTLHNKNVFYLLYYLYLFIIWTHYIVIFSCIPIISGFQPCFSLLYATLWFFAVFSKSLFLTFVKFQTNIHSKVYKINSWNFLPVIPTYILHTITLIWPWQMTNESWHQWSITFGQSPKTQILTNCFVIILKSQTFQAETISLYEGTFYLINIANFMILHKHVVSEYLYENRMYSTFSNVGCHGNTYAN